MFSRNNSEFQQGGGRRREEEVQEERSKKNSRTFRSCVYVCVGGPGPDGTGSGTSALWSLTKWKQMFCGSSSSALFSAALGSTTKHRSETFAVPEFEP